MEIRTRERKAENALLSPTRLEGMEIAQRPNSRQSVSKSPTRLEGMEMPLNRDENLLAVEVSDPP